MRFTNKLIVIAAIIGGLILGPLAVFALAQLVQNGGTGVASFGQGWIFSPGGSNNLAASTSPTVNYITATSTFATSSFAAGVQATAINSTGNSTSTFKNGVSLSTGCFSDTGGCLTHTGSSASSTLLSDNNTFSGLTTLSGGASTTVFSANNIFLQNWAVSTSTVACPDGQTIGCSFAGPDSVLKAWQAGYKMVHMKEGTYSITQEQTFTQSGSGIIGEGDGSAFSYNGTGIRLAIGSGNLGVELGNMIFENFRVNETGAGGRSTCLELSRVVNSLVSHVHCDKQLNGFMASTSQSYYNTFDTDLVTHLTNSIGAVSSYGFYLGDNGSGDGGPINDTVINATVSNFIDASSTSYYFNSHSEKCISCDSENGNVGMQLGPLASDFNADVYLEANTKNLVMAADANGSVNIKGNISDASPLTNNIVDNGVAGLSVNARVQYAPVNYTTGNNVGVATSSPGTIFSIGNIANFASATSTLYTGLNLTTGCVAIKGVCIGSSSASSTLLSDNNTFSGLNSFTNAGTTTFTGGIQTAAINETGNSTSTFTNGISLNGGCLSVNGICLGGQKQDSVTLGSTWTADYVTNGTNDQTACNNALTYLSAIGGGTLKILPGTYNFSSGCTGNGSNITVEGSGEGVTTININYTSSGNNFGLTFIPSGTNAQNNIIVRDISFNSNGFRTAGLALIANASTATTSRNFLVDHVEFYGKIGDSTGSIGSLLIKGAYSGVVGDISDVRVTNSIFRDNIAGGSGTNAFSITTLSDDLSNFSIDHTIFKNLYGIAINATAPTTPRARRNWSIDHNTFYHTEITNPLASTTLSADFYDSNRLGFQNIWFTNNDFEGDPTNVPSDALFSQTNMYDIMVYQSQGLYVDSNIFKNGTTLFAPGYSQGSPADDTNDDQVHFTNNTIDNYLRLADPDGTYNAIYANNTFKNIAFCPIFGGYGRHYPENVSDNVLENPCFRSSTTQDFYQASFLFEGGGNVADNNTIYATSSPGTAHMGYVFAELCSGQTLPNIYRNNSIIGTGVGTSTFLLDSGCAHIIQNNSGVTESKIINSYQNSTRNIFSDLPPTDIVSGNTTINSTYLFNPNIFGGFVGISTSSPYAWLSIAGTSTNSKPLFAISTSTAIATSTAFIVDKNGLVGISTSTPGSLLAINGVGNFVNGATSTLQFGLNTAALNVTGNASSTFNNGINLNGGCFSINGTCLSNQNLSLPLSINNGGTATTTQVTNGVNYYDGSKITSSLAFTWDTSKLITIGNDGAPSDSNGAFFVKSSTNNNQYLHMGYNTSGEYSWIESVKTGSALEPLALNPRGSVVEIGTSTVTGSGNLVVQGSGSYGQIKVIGSSANGESDIGFRAPNIVNGVSGTWLAGVNIGTSNQTFSISNGGTNALNILTNGFVGIGTTTPGATLSVVGNIIASSTATSTFAGNGVNLTAGCFAVNGTCVGSGTTLSGGVAGMLAGWTGAITIAPTSTPTVSAILATSTTATSSFMGRSTHFGSSSCGTGGLTQFGLQGLEDCGTDNTDTGGVQILESNNSNGASAWGGFTLNNDQADNTFTHFSGIYYNSSGYNSSFFGGLFAYPSLLTMQNTDGPISILASTSTLSKAFIEFGTGGVASSSIALNINGYGTSTFSKPIVVNGTTGTSTFANGIDLSTGTGCFSISGTCLQTLVSSASAYKQAVKYASTSTLPSNTYSNGVNGIGATLTGTVNGPFYIDGNTPSVGDRVLVKNEATGANNGVYTVTTVGVVGVTAYVLTRATDYNSSADVFPGVANFVNSGTVNANSCWILTNTSAVTIGTTALTYDDACGVGSFTGTYPIIVSGTVISSGLGTTTANNWSGLQTFSNSGTTTLAGGIEDGKAIAAPYLMATSTTATSTFTADVQVGGTMILNNTTSKLGIGTSSPIYAFSVSNSTANKWIEWVISTITNIAAPIFAVFENNNNGLATTTGMTVNSTSTLDALTVFGSTHLSPRDGCRLIGSSLFSGDQNSDSGMTTFSAICGGEFAFDINTDGRLRAATNVENNQPLSRRFDIGTGATNVANEFAYLKSNIIGSATSSPAIAFEAMMRLPNTNVSTTSVEYAIGFSDVAGTSQTTTAAYDQPSNGCELVASSTANFKLVAIRNGVETIIDSTISTSSMQTGFQTLRVGLNSQGCYAAENGVVLVGIPAANAPVASLRAFIGLGSNSGPGQNQGRMDMANTWVYSGEKY